MNLVLRVISISCFTKTEWVRQIEIWSMVIIGTFETIANIKSNCGHRLENNIFKISTNEYNELVDSINTSMKEENNRKFIDSLMQPFYSTQSFVLKNDSTLTQSNINFHEVTVGVDLLQTYSNLWTK